MRVDEVGPRRYLSSTSESSQTSAASVNSGRIVHEQATASMQWINRSWLQLRGALSALQVARVYSGRKSAAENSLIKSRQVLHPAFGD